jgi:hypothetical protein
MQHIATTLVAVFLSTVATMVRANEAGADKQPVTHVRLVECIAGTSSEPPCARTVVEILISDEQPRSVLVGGQVAAPDGQIIDYGTRIDTSARFTERGAVALALTVAEIEIVSLPGEFPRTKTKLTGKNVDIEPGQIVKVPWLKNDGTRSWAEIWVGNASGQ